MWYLTTFLSYLTCQLISLIGKFYFQKPRFFVTDVQRGSPDPRLCWHGHGLSVRGEV